MSRTGPRKIVSASLSDVGRVRSENQDAFAEFSDAEGTRLLLVADGMGGHRGGATASRLAVQTFGEAFYAAAGDPESRLRLAFEAANERVHRRALEEPELSGMGTTGVALLLARSGSGWVAHVGDSRAYRVRDGGIDALTADHSVVAEMVRVGLLRSDEAAEHPDRHVILRALGSRETVEVDLAPVSVQAGDRFVLCSDGLVEVVSDAEIADVVSRETPEAAVGILVGLANQRGAPDNVTVQVAQVVAAGAAPARRTLPSARWRPALLAAFAAAVLLVAALLARTSCDSRPGGPSAAETYRGPP